MKRARKPKRKDWQAVAEQKSAAYEQLHVADRIKSFSEHRHRVKGGYLVRRK